MKSSCPFASWILGFACFPWCLFLLADAHAEAPAKTTVARPILEYRSNHLHVRTDLEQDEAEALYARLEKTLQFAARYWGRECRGQIECYVVDDLDNWSDEQLPHKLSRVIIFGIGGATVPHVVRTGNRVRSMPVVFAASRRGIAEHEVIHAYCIQTFGTGGPEWYKEGMAEIASRGSTRDSGMQCSREQFASLRTGKHSTINEVLAVGDTRTLLSAALNSMMEDPLHKGRHVSVKAWKQQHADHVAQARDEYLRSWAFCYLLLNNPNYTKRFRASRTILLTEQQGTFDNCFEAVRGEIAFEYEFLLDHVAVGYRVDLCRWDWQTQFQRLEDHHSHRTLVKAARGFQASGLEVVAGQRYNCQADGRWSTGAGCEMTDADGREDDSSRLVGVVMNGFKLGEPFLLGTSSSFVAPMDGRLHLRCNDAWNELGDNEGHIVVKFRRP
jgi:hypothetical protein